MTASQAALRSRYDADLVIEPPTLPPPELFPKRHAWAVRQEDGRRVLDVMSWGFPPPPKASPAPVTNVRNLASPFWKSALANPARRCLVPFTDFCEWEGEKGSKTARWFNAPAREIVSFAGIWRPTEAGPAMAFLTCGYLGDPAQHIVGAVHPKACPVILHEEDEQAWLDGSYDDVCALAQPYPSQLMAIA